MNRIFVAGGPLLGTCAALGLTACSAIDPDPSALTSPPVETQEAELQALFDAVEPLAATDLEVIQFRERSCLDEQAPDPASVTHWILKLASNDKAAAKDFSAGLTVWGATPGATTTPNRSEANQVFKKDDLTVTETTYVDGRVELYTGRHCTKNPPNHVLGKNRADQNPDPNLPYKWSDAQ